MAIYHLCVKTISRSSGRSSVASAAYRAGEKITNEYDGITHDFTRRTDVIYKEVILPENAPKEYADRNTLWNAVELSEKRKDGRTAREIEIALPVELSRTEQIELIKEYVNTEFITLGMCADICIHSGHKDKPRKNKDYEPIDAAKPENPHAHILLTDRPITKQGFADKKDRSWNDKKNVEKWREAWADCANVYLDKKKVPKIDHRSYERQGIDKIPNIHLGVKFAALQRRGIKTVRGNKFEEIIEKNNKIQEYHKEIDLLTKELKRIEIASVASYDIKNIPIIDYAASLGFTLVNKGRYFTLKEHDSVMIDPVKNCFWHNSMGVVGNIINFVIEYSVARDTNEATDILKKHYGIKSIEPLPASATVKAPATETTANRAEPLPIPTAISPSTKPTINIDLIEKARKTNDKFLSYLIKNNSELNPEVIKKASYLATSQGLILIIKNKELRYVSIENWEKTLEIVKKHKEEKQISPKPLPTPATVKAPVTKTISEYIEPTVTTRPSTTTARSEVLPKPTEPTTPPTVTLPPKFNIWREKLKKIKTLTDQIDELDAQKFGFFEHSKKKERDTNVIELKKERNEIYTELQNIKELEIPYYQYLSSFNAQNIIKIGNENIDSLEQAYMDKDKPSFMDNLNAELDAIMARDDFGRKNRPQPRRNKDFDR